MIWKSFPRGGEHAESVQKAKDQKPEQSRLNVRKTNIVRFVEEIQVPPYAVDLDGEYDVATVLAFGER